MAIWAPFTPSDGETKSIAATTTSQSVALSTAGEDQIVVTNTDAVTNTRVAHVAFGDSTVTAATSDMPILPSSRYLLSKPPGATHVAVRMSTGTATVYFTPGRGS
jgi:hypothetical protein